MADLPANHPEIDPKKWEPLYGDPFTKDNPKLDTEPSARGERALAAAKAARAARPTPTPDEPAAPAEATKPV